MADQTIPDRVLAWAVRRPERLAGLNPWEVVVRLWRETVDDRLAGLAAEMAFFALLSLAPLLLAIGAALGYVQHVVGATTVARAEQAVVDTLGFVFAADALGDFVQGLLRVERGGLAVGGVAAALWLSSRVFAATIRALDLAYDVEERRNYIVQRLTALGFAVVSVVAVTVLLTMMVVGPLLGGAQWVAERFGLGDAFTIAWRIGRWPVLVAVLVAFLVLLYRYGPNVRHGWRDCFPGAVLALLLWLGLSIALRAYLQGGAPAGQLPEEQAVEAVGKALSAIIAGVLWVYLSSIAILLGGELNAEVEKLRRSPGEMDGRPPL